jgi:hypothetical protein
VKLGAHYVFVVKGDFAKDHTFELDVIVSVRKATEDLLLIEYKRYVLSYPCFLRHEQVAR